MSEQDSLRLVAEVVDKFSGPLRNLRASLQGMSRDGASHSEAVAKGLNRVEGAAKSAGQTATTVLNPALAAIGITGLGVVAAMTGVGSAMRSLGGSVSALATLGRETGVSAENLRVLQSVMGKFGIEAESSAGAIKTFAQNMRLAKDGIGPIMEFLRTQGKTSEGRAYFNQLADSLKNSKDNGEALMKALEGLEHIQDPAGRMTYAQQIFGNADIGRLGDQHLGRLRDVIEKQRKLLGPLSEGTVKAAEEFDRAMSALSTTMSKLGTAIATEAMPYLSEFVKGIQGLVDGGRQDVTGQLRAGVRDLGAALREIDWKAAGEAAGGFMKGASDGAKALVEVVREVAAILRSLNEGKYLDALRGGDGASGPLARRLAPKVGDDEVAAQEKVDGVNKEADLARSITGKPTAPMAPELQGRLNQAEAELQALRDRSPEQRQRAFSEAPLQDRIAGIQRQLQNFDAMSASGTASAAATKRAEDLRREMGKLTDELRRLREALPDKKPGEATVQQQSFDGAGNSSGLDPSLLHKASYGVANSMNRVGSALAGMQSGGRGSATYGDPHVMDRLRAFLQHHGYGRAPVAPRFVPNGPGQEIRRRLQGDAEGDGSLPFGDSGARLYGGPGEGKGRFPEHQRGQLREEFRKYLMRKVPGYDGGPMVPNLVPGGPGDRVGRALRGEPPAGAEGRHNARLPETPGQYRPQYPVGEADLDQRVVNTIAGEVSTKNAEGVDAVINNMMNRVGSKGWGPSKNLLDVARAPGQYAGYRKAGEAESEFVRSRIRAIASGGVPDNTAGANSYRAETYYRQTMGQGKGYWAGRAAIGPNVGGNRYAFEAGFPNGPYAPFDPKAINSARSTPKGTADGAGFAARHRAMQELVDDRKELFKVPADSPIQKALRSGAMGSTPRVDANGKVQIHIDKAGPDARVSTSASGNLFRDVETSRGRTMARASQEN